MNQAGLRQADLISGDLVVGTGVIWGGYAAARWGGSFSLKSNVACGDVSPVGPDLSIFQKKPEIQTVCV